MRLEYRARVGLADGRIPQVIPSHRLARHARTLQQAAFLSASASHLHGAAHLQHEQASIAESLIAHRRAAVGDLNAGSGRPAVSGPQPAAPPPLRTLTVAIPTPRLEEADEERHNTQQQQQPQQQPQRQQQQPVSSSSSSPVSASLSLPAMEDVGASRASSPSPSEVLDAPDAPDAAEASDAQHRASSPFTLGQLSAAAAPAASFDSEMVEGDGDVDGDVLSSSSSPSPSSPAAVSSSSSSRASSSTRKRSTRLQRVYRRMRSHSREEEEAQSDNQSVKPPSSSSPPPRALFPSSSSSPLAVYQLDANKFSAPSPGPPSVFYPAPCLPPPVLLSSPTAVFPQQQQQQSMMQQPPLSFPQLLYLQAQQPQPQPVHYFPFFPLQPAVYLQPQQQMPRYLPHLFFSAPILSPMPSQPRPSSAFHPAAAARSAQCPYLISTLPSTLPSHVSSAALRASA